MSPRTKLVEIKYLKLNDRANTTYQNLGEATEVEHQGTLIAINAHIKPEKV